MLKLVSISPATNNGYSMTTGILDMVRFLGPPSLHVVRRGGWAIYSRLDVMYVTVTMSVSTLALKYEGQESF